MILDAITRHSLAIFSEGEEVDGFTLYAYWPREQIVSAKFKVGQANDFHVRGSSVRGPGWTVGVWDIQVRKWPSAVEWPAFIQNALQGALSLGSVVSWGATEGAFVDPPDLFDPQSMPTGVWVARTHYGYSFGPPGLDSPIEFLTVPQMRFLHTYILVDPSSR